MAPQKFIGGAERARRQAQSRGWEPPSQRKRRLERESEQNQRQRSNKTRRRREISVPLSTKKLRSSERFFASLLDAPNYRKASISGLVTISERLGLGPPPLYRYHDNGTINPALPHTDNPQRFFASRAILVMEEARHELEEAFHKKQNSSWIEMRPISFDLDEKRTGFLKVGLQKASGRFSPEDVLQQRPGSCFEMEIKNKSTREQVTMLCSVAPGKPGSKLVLTIYGRASIDRLLSLLCGDDLEDPLTVAVAELWWNIRFITSLLSHCRQFEACDFGCSRHHKRAALLKEIMGQKRATHIRFGDSDNSEKEEIVGYIAEDGDYVEDDDNKSDRQPNDCDNTACEKEKQHSKLHLTMSSFTGLKAPNPTQQMAADKFCNSEESNPTLELIQGPPGTGKTTFVVSVLARLLCEASKRKRRILVTAPTNKAVGVIAKRFLESCPGLLDQHGVPISMIGVKDKLLEPDDDGNVDRNLKRIFCYTWLDTLAEDYESLQLSLTMEANRSSLVCTPGNRSLSAWIPKASPSSKNETFMVGDDSDSDTEDEEEKESSNRPAFQGIHLNERSASSEKAKGLCLRLIRNLPHWSEASGAANLSRKIVGFLEEDGDIDAASAYITTLVKILKDDESKDDESNCGDEDDDDNCDDKRGIRAAAAIPALLATARIVFCTLSTAGTSLMKQTRRFDDLIVDEAAAATEPELLIPLYVDPHRLLVVGDPKQLPATVSSPLAEQLGLGRSLHERLTVDLGRPQTMLDVQYRMKPEIAKFPSQRFYGGKLVDGENVKEATYGSLLSSSSSSNGWDLVQGTPPFCFFQVNGKEEQSHTGSYYNKEEACALVTLLKAIRHRLHQREKTWSSPDTIRVITFYSAQVAVLRQALRREGLQGVLVATVDSSQGCEADLVVLSFVRTTRAGFLRDDRRLNVALTRARHKLVCLGNVTNSNWALGESSSTTLTNLLGEANARGCVSMALAEGKPLWRKTSASYK